MAFVTWKASYSVKVASCDADHKKMSVLINRLHHAMAVGRGAGMVQSLANELAAYSRRHFAEEESMMARTKYPELASHRQEHQEFARRLEQIRQDLAAGKFVSSVPVAAFFNGWFTSHITQTDQKYSAHLNANGIS